EARDGPPPVLLVRVGRALLARHPLAPLDQPGAGTAGHHLVLDGLQRRGQVVRGRHPVTVATPPRPAGATQGVGSVTGWPDAPRHRSPRWCSWCGTGPP